MEQKDNKYLQTHLLMLKVLVAVMISETQLMFNFEDHIEIEKVFEVFSSSDLEKVL